VNDELAKHEMFYMLIVRLD